MVSNQFKKASAVLGCFIVMTQSTYAGEDLFGHLKLAEPLPKGAWEVYQTVTSRSDKGTGSYQAYNTETEIEYGLTDRFTISGALLGQSLNTSGLLIDAYMPGDKAYGLQVSGVEAKMAYNFLSAAKDDLGVTGFFGVESLRLDPHSGQDKNTFSLTTGMNVQKYFMEGQLIWAGNWSMEATKATRAPIADLPDGFEWPTEAEVELEFSGGTGLSYRFMPNWFIGAELQYQEEYETEVNRERFSLFGGPSIHYGGESFWFTLSWLTQLNGGGESYAGQPGGLHLIEKTKQEIIAKVGFNF